MTYEKQIWKDRQVQYPNRYVDQNGNILQLERSPGTVTENGSLFNAEKMNHIENGIEAVDNANQTNTTNIKANSKSIEGLKGKILWTNPNPTNDFSAGNITLSSDDYDVLEFYYNNDLTVPTMSVIKTLKGYGAHMSYMSNGSIRWWARRITYVNDTTFSVPDCILINSEGGSIDNAKCIPLYVAGYKTGLFDEVSE